MIATAVKAFFVLAVTFFPSVSLRSTLGANFVFFWFVTLVGVVFFYFITFETNLDTVKNFLFDVMEGNAHLKSS